ncbi:MFS transporter [Isachenkonia alkalipeptolytica]|uniref:MFS transporter n=1 Tax=Isachenkonia alkalipeptolytica TaxID=2565777 RepID=A0AA43XLA1_9CLOT|nr:MFS transporter [Isachenkonia alkalipeptolytica]NBG88928.1 MFS transporter [Isachenkonia alkalipeptolytica]
MDDTSKTSIKNNESYVLTLIIMSTAYIAVGINVQGFKAMLPLVSADFQISGTQAGLYATFFFLSGTLLAIVSGRVVDKIGPKKSLVGATLIIATLMFLHTLMPVFSVLLLLAFLTGIGFSIITPAINKGVMDLVPPNKRAVSIGIAQSGGGIGGILGASLLPFLGGIFGWRVALLVAAAVAFLMALVLVKCYRPKKKQDNKTNQGQEELPGSFKKDFKKLSSNPLLIFICFMGAAFGFTIGNMTIHYTLFLTADIGLTPSYAGFALSAFMLGGIAGQPSMGYMNDRFLNSNRRLGLFLLGLITSVMLLIIGSVVFSGSLGFVPILAVSFVLGFFSLAIPGLVFTTIGDVVEDKLVGTATGIILVFIRTGVVIGPPLIGYIADLRGNYQASWILLSLVILIISVIFFAGTRKYKAQLYGG